MSNPKSLAQANLCAGAVLPKLVRANGKENPARHLEIARLAEGKRRSGACFSCRSGRRCRDKKRAPCAQTRAFPVAERRPTRHLEGEFRQGLRHRLIAASEA